MTIDGIGVMQLGEENFFEYMLTRDLSFGEFLVSVFFLREYLALFFRVQLSLHMRMLLRANVAAASIWRSIQVDLEASSDVGCIVISRV